VNITKQDAAIFAIVGIATVAVELSINSVVCLALPVTLLACYFLLEGHSPKVTPLPHNVKTPRE
jgi:hypothetical protein